MTDKDKIKKLMGALSFYADPDTYFGIGFFPDRPCGDFINDFIEVGSHEWTSFKPGKKAREVLAEVGRSIIGED